MRLVFRTAAIAAVIAGLLACGGGGDSVHSTPQAPTFNADAAFANALGGGATLSGLKATDPAGFRYVASLAYSSLSSGSFSGIPALQSLQTATIGRVGEVPMTDAITVYYDTAPSRLLATVTATGKTTVFLQGQGLPTAGRVGQSGQFAVGTAYATPALGVPVGTEVLTWSIEPDGATTALACLASESRTSVSVSIEKDCFRIDGAGNISGGTVSIDKSGLVLHFVQ